jgi:hypothetical protein
MHSSSDKSNIINTTSINSTATENVNNITTLVAAPASGPPFAIKSHAQSHSQAVLGDYTGDPHPRVRLAALRGLLMLHAREKLDLKLYQRVVSVLVPEETLGGSSDFGVYEFFLYDFCC